MLTFLHKSGLFLLIASSLVYAGGEGKLAGTVMSIDGEPLAGANVIIDATEATANVAAATQIYDAVARRVAAGELNDRAAAVSAAVRDVLAAELPAVDENARLALAVQVASVLLADPALSGRLDRLLAP